MTRHQGGDKRGAISKARGRKIKFYRHLKGNTSTDTPGHKDV